MPEARPFPLPPTWTWYRSPNHGPRKAHVPVSAIVLHADASPSIEGTLEWIATPKPKNPNPVSYHVVIGRNGRVYVSVHPDRRAWHAGTSSLDGVADCNTFAVGVCLSNKNDGAELYPPAQVMAAADVCAALCRHYGIPVERIVTHAHVSPGRKTDPKGFDVPAFRATVEQMLVPTPRAA